MQSACRLQCSGFRPYGLVRWHYARCIDPSKPIITPMAAIGRIRTLVATATVDHATIPYAHAREQTAVKQPAGSTKGRQDAGSGPYQSATGPG